MRSRLEASCARWLDHQKLRWSYEQGADVVMFLYRDEIYHPDSPDKGTAEVITAKNRHGPVGAFQLAFIDRYTRFANTARLNS